MPAIALGDGNSRVFSKTGRKRRCRFPVRTTTDECSTKVLVGGIGVVRAEDQVAPHNASGCLPDTSTLTASTASSKVFCEGKRVAHIGSQYTSDNIITSGSSKVFIGR
jgi:uncharacterized Zn-binding protein involved in type VI secretion